VPATAAAAGRPGYLLARGADCYWIGWDGLTPLDTADREDATDLVQWLRDLVPNPPPNSADHTCGGAWDAGSTGSVERTCCVAWRTWPIWRLGHEYASWAYTGTEDGSPRPAILSGKAT
jgi:hypothetical protein